MAKSDNVKDMDFWEPIKTSDLVIGYAKNGNFSEWAELLGSYQKKYEQGEIPDWMLDVAFKNICVNKEQGKNTEEWDNTFKEWNQSESAKTYAAQICMAVYWYNRAWEERGVKFIQDTSQSQIEKMEEMILNSKEHVAKSLILSEKPILSYDLMVDLSMMTGDVDPKAAYDKAEKLDPENYTVKLSYFYSLLPKWGGAQDYSDVGNMIDNLEQQGAKQEIITFLKNKMYLEIAGDLSWRMQKASDQKELKSKIEKQVIKFLKENVERAGAYKDKGMYFDALYRLASKFSYTEVPDKYNQSLMYWDELINTCLVKRDDGCTEIDNSFFFPHMSNATGYWQGFVRYYIKALALDETIPEGTTFDPKGDHYKKAFQYIEALNKIGVPADEQNKLIVEIYIQEAYRRGLELEKSRFDLFRKGKVLKNLALYTEAMEILDKGSRSNFYFSTLRDIATYTAQANVSETPFHDALPLFHKLYVECKKNRPKCEDSIGMDYLYYYTWYMLHDETIPSSNNMMGSPTSPLYPALLNEGVDYWSRHTPQDDKQKKKAGFFYAYRGTYKVISQRDTEMESAFLDFVNGHELGDEFATRKLAQYYCEGWVDTSNNQVKLLSSPNTKFINKERCGQLLRTAVKYGDEYSKFLLNHYGLN